MIEIFIDKILYFISQLGNSYVFFENFNGSR